MLLALDVFNFFRPPDLDLDFELEYLLFLFGLDLLLDLIFFLIFSATGKGFFFSKLPFFLATVPLPGFSPFFVLTFRLFFDLDRDLDDDELEDEDELEEEPDELKLEE